MANKQNGKKALKLDPTQVNAAIRNACARSFGVLDTGFLCQPVGILNPHQPFCVAQDASVDSVMVQLKSQRIGCVIVVDAQGKISGIFSERDYTLKVYGSEIDCKKTPVEKVMTKEPVTEKLDSTIAFALNLMSQGGFRHLPIVDDAKMPVGIISVKDVVDHIVESFVADLLAMPLAESL